MPQCPWERLVDLRIFQGFRPGMNFEEAEAAFGKEDEAGRNEFGPFKRYKRPLGIVQIGREDQSSLIVPDIFWTLRGYLPDASATSVFSSEVVERLPNRKAPLEVAILNGCGYPMVSIDFNEHRKVRLITWLENPGSFHPDRLSATSFDKASP